MASERPQVRPAREGDAELVARLLYETAAGLYDVYAGGSRRALKILAAAYRRPGNSASQEVVTVALLDGAVVGALAAFPVDEGEARGRRFLRVTLAHTPPWRWPGRVRVYRAGGDVTPPPPAGSLYVDALATARGSRRRGVAAALLDEAARQARAAGLDSVALDTLATNTAAQALYAATGFTVTERRPSRKGFPGVVGYVRRLG